MTSSAERRSRKRVASRVTAQVRSQSGEHQAETRDISTNGVFLYCSSRIETGTEVELVMILPPEVTVGGKCWVCCQATVVRVEESGPRFGVAATIHRMDVLPEAEI
jgi:PilZ domain